MTNETNLPARTNEALTGSLAAMPEARSIVMEAVTHIIPNQRIARIDAFLSLLTARLDKLDREKLKAELSDPHKVDLFEEGVVQSVRAISEERKAYIAQLVAYGLTGDDKWRIESKRLLGLLEAIDDDQIIVLASYLSRHRHDEEFHNRHANILAPVRAHLGSSREELDAHTVQELTRSHLIRLGLLDMVYPEPRRGELPEFDKQTGMLKGGYRRLSPLGRLLLARIGLIEPEEGF